MPRGGPLIVKDFIIPALKNKTYADTLFWINEERCVFTLRLTHRNNALWNERVVQVFKDWDTFKKRPNPGNSTDSKQRFKNALRKCNFIRFPTDDEYKELNLKKDKLNLYYIFDKNAKQTSKKGKRPYAIRRESSSSEFTSGCTSNSDCDVSPLPMSPEYEMLLLPTDPEYDTSPLPMSPEYDMSPLPMSPEYDMSPLPMSPEYDDPILFAQLEAVPSQDLALDFEMKICDDGILNTGAARVFELIQDSNGDILEFNDENQVVPGTVEETSTTLQDFREHDHPYVTPNTGLAFLAYNAGLLFETPRLNPNPSVQEEYSDDEIEHFFIDPSHNNHLV